MRNKKMGRVSQKCLVCGGVYTCVYSAKDRRKYCSRDCHLLYRESHPVRYWLGRKFSRSHKDKLIESHRGDKHYLWKGKIYDKSGYVLVNRRTHPNCNPNGYVREHRLVMEEYIGRLLTRDEVVHHINGIKDDNKINNLRLYSSHSEHMRDEYKDGKITGINQGKI